MDLTTKKQLIVDELKTPITYNILDGIMRMPSSVKGEALSNPAPIVCIINGAGGNGKDTFVDAVGHKVAMYNISSIDDIKEIGEVLCEKVKGVVDQMPVNPINESKAKTNTYRKFLSKVKGAWEEFCDGPTWSMVAGIDTLIRRQIQGLERHDLIFLHIREPQNIAKMKQLIEERYGVICLTLIVSGMIDPSQFDNDSDRLVENYDYDLRVVNTPGDLNGFRERAALFGERLARINSVCGVELPMDNSTPVDMPEQSEEM